MPKFYRNRSRASGARRIARGARRRRSSRAQSRQIQALAKNQARLLEHTEVGKCNWSFRYVHGYGQDEMRSVYPQNIGNKAYKDENGDVLVDNQDITRFPKHDSIPPMISPHKDAKLCPLAPEYAWQQLHKKYPRVLPLMGSIVYDAFPSYLTRDYFNQVLPISPSFPNPQDTTNPSWHGNADIIRIQPEIVMQSFLDEKRNRRLLTTGPLVQGPTGLKTFRDRGYDLQSQADAGMGPQQNQINMGLTGLPRDLELPDANSPALDDPLPNGFEGPNLLAPPPGVLDADQTLPHGADAHKDTYNTLTESQISVMQNDALWAFLTYPEHVNTIPVNLEGTYAERTYLSNPMQYSFVDAANGGGAGSGGDLTSSRWKRYWQSMVTFREYLSRFGTPTQVSAINGTKWNGPYVYNGTAGWVDAVNDGVASIPFLMHIAWERFQNNDQYNKHFHEIREKRVFNHMRMNSIKLKFQVDSFNTVTPTTQTFWVIKIKRAHYKDVLNWCGLSHAGNLASPDSSAVDLATTDGVITDPSNAGDVAALGTPLSNMFIGNRTIFPDRDSEPPNLTPSQIGAATPSFELHNKGTATKLTSLKNARKIPHDDPAPIDWWLPRLWDESNRGRLWVTGSRVPFSTNAEPVDFWAHQKTTQDASDTAVKQQLQAYDPEDKAHCNVISFDHSQNVHFNPKYIKVVRKKVIRFDPAKVPGHPFGNSLLLGPSNPPGSLSGVQHRQRRGWSWKIKLGHQANRTSHHAEWKEKDRSLTMDKHHFGDKMLHDFDPWTIPYLVYNSTSSDLPDVFALKEAAEDVAGTLRPEGTVQSVNLGNQSPSNQVVDNMQDGVDDIRALDDLQRSLVEASAKESAENVANGLAATDPPEGAHLLAGLETDVRLTEEEIYNLLRQTQHPIMKLETECSLTAY